MYVTTITTQARQRENIVPFHRYDNDNPMLSRSSLPAAPSIILALVVLSSSENLLRGKACGGFLRSLGTLRKSPSPYGVRRID